MQLTTLILSTFLFTLAYAQTPGSSSTGDSGSTGTGTGDDAAAASGLGQECQNTKHSEGCKG